MVSSGGDELNVELNLTSMIDLMSVLVTFLLMTAVWQQYSAIEAVVDTKGRAANLTITPTDRQVVVKATSSGHQIAWPEKMAKFKLPNHVSKTGTGYDFAQITEIMKVALAKDSDLQAAIASEDMVPYGSVVETIDATKSGGFASVALATN